MCCPHFFHVSFHPLPGPSAWAASRPEPRSMITVSPGFVPTNSQLSASLCDLRRRCAQRTSCLPTHALRLTHHLRLGQGLLLPNMLSAQAYHVAISSSDDAISVNGNESVFTVGRLRAVCATESPAASTDALGGVSAATSPESAPLPSCSMIVRMPVEVNLAGEVPTKATAEAGYKLQAPLETLDILVPRRRYSPSEGVVIGTLCPKGYPRKRRRGEGE